MKFCNYEMVLLTDQKQRQYFLGFNSSAGYVMLFRDVTVFVVDSRYYFAAKKALAKREKVDVICSGEYNAFVDYVKCRKIKYIGIDFSVTTVSQFEFYKKILPEGTVFYDVGTELSYKMSLKKDEEVRCIKRACAIAEKSFLEALACLEEGVTEVEVAAELEYRFKMNGASDKSFDTIIAFGANSAIPHHETGHTQLREGMPVLMDFGCIYKGYCSDMTRTLYFGKPTEDFINNYKAVYDAHMNVMANVRAGMTGSEADAFARDLLKERGLGDYFTHSLGHGIGVHVHEAPYLAPKRQNVLENGMVFSNEPGVYFNGKYGIRIEDTCYMKDDVVHTLMKDDKRLLTIQNGKNKKLSF